MHILIVIAIVAVRMLICLKQAERDQRRINYKDWWVVYRPV